ncbi:MAG: Ig-like domain-containing protein, partial [bacterium]
MKINGIVRLCIIAASLVCSVLASFAQADGLSFDVIEPKVNSVISKAPMMIEISFRSPIDVTSFEAYIDSKLLIKGNLRTPMPNGHFSVPANYQTLRLTPGKHFFTVKLFDVLGKVAQRTVGITLQNSITAEKNPPTVKITNPIDNSVIQKDEDVQITVEASDDSGIKWVLVYINDDVRAMMNVAPYIAPWNPVRENFKAGAYIITAKAIDLFENPATSKPVRVRFEPFQRTNLPIIEAYNPIASGSAVFPTFGNVYNRFSPADLLNQGWADGIPTGLPQMMTNVDSRLMVMANSAVNQFGTVPMRIAPENINETIAGSPVLALTMPPALSAISGMVNPMSIKGYSYTPMYVSLPAPTGEALPRTGVSENPLVPTETIGSKTATTTTIKNTVVNTAQTVSQLPGVGKTNIPQQDVVLGKGKFTGNPSTLDTPNATDQRVADLSNPMMIAKLPGKVSTGIEIPKIDAAVIASATTIANTPSTGADTTKINNTATTTLTRPNANAPLVENNINGKNVQTVNPGITANNPTRVTPQITAPANTGTANVASTTGNTPATGGDANKIANTSSTSLTRPGANAPALDNSVTGKNVQTATPGITANNPTRVTPQITAPATSGATDVANSTGVAPTTGNDNIKPVTLSNGQIAPTRSNVTVGEKNGAPRSVAAAVPTVKGSSSKISPQATNTTSTVNTVIAKSSTVSPANPTVNQQTVAGTKITTRSDPANPTTIATTGRIVDSTTPEVKIASGVKPHGQPTIGTQSPAIITNNST